MGTDGEGIRELIITSGCPLRCKYCINPFTWDGSKPVKELTAKEIYEKIKLDRPYILTTNGGITIGGGEPLLQPDLFLELRDIIEPEMTLYAETSFCVPYENIVKVVDVVDRFYVDIKTTDIDIYRSYTGGDLSIALKNLEKYIKDYSVDKLVVRIPTIPEFACEDDQIRSKELLEKIGVKRFNLFNYRVPKQDDK